MNRKSKTFIIAEAGINHNGSLNLAKKLINLSKKAGADAVKFQTFKAEDVISRFANKLKYQKNKKNDNQTQLEMLKSYELSEKDFLNLKKYCISKKIKFMSTPKDIKSAKFLKKINMDIFKIGSGEAINYELIKEVCSYKKKTIISTGMCNLKEVNKIFQIFKKNKKNLSLLHCTSLYPCPVEDCNLLSINTLKNLFNVGVGFSDHTIGIDAAPAAVAMGASIIEKHITLDNKMEGPDHKTSLNFKNFKKMVQKIRLIEKYLGSGEKKPTSKEKKNIKLVRRGLVYADNFNSGKKIKSKDIEIKRPMIGLRPEDKKKILGKKLLKKVLKDQPINLSHF